MPESVNKNLLAAFRYLLKPLVRMALKHGVLFPDFSEALKEAYVDVGAKQLSAPGKEASEEGISLITNVEKIDVRTILKGGSDATFGRSAQRVSPMAVILSAWHTDPKYSGPYGVLRDLQFAPTAPKDQGDSFSALASAHCPGISPRALLEELLSIGAVEEVGSGFYRAVKRSYVPPPLSVPSILNLARVVHNLCETLEVNLRAVAERGEGLMERTIFTVHGIPRDQHPEFNKYIRLRGQAFADDIDNWITVRDEEGIKDGMHIGVGFYHYIVNEDDEVGLSKDLPT
jgi:Family of unknown function (DUF6502)